MIGNKLMTITVERKNGITAQVMEDGTLRPLADKTDWTRLNALTETEIEAAAGADLDNPLLTETELKTFRPVPNPKEIRKRLHMTQQQFAEQFELPLGTLRDWEQGTREPDSAAKSYLRVIAKNPQGVIQALNS
jgi:putative transcriptional regulator